MTENEKDTKLVHDTLIHVALSARRDLPVKHEDAILALRVFERLKAVAAGSLRAAEEAIK